jgi:hypothetical protein
MAIDYLRIMIVPYPYAGHDAKELEVDIQINSVRHSFRQVVHNDDMTSRFDYFFDMAREAVRHVITEGTAMKR